MKTPPKECANCGAALPPNAKACPECGADERTGWRDNSVYDGLDLPEEAWRDDSANSVPPNRPAQVNGIAWYWWVVGAVLLLLLIFGGLGVP